MTDNIMMLEVRTGVEVNQDSATETVEKMINIMKGDFGLIINRVNDYSIDPFSIYTYLNTKPSLKAMAIVVHRESYLKLMPMQQNIFKNPIEGFLALEDAIDWMHKILKQQASTNTSSTSHSAKE
ncbi:MAG: hypothetical protein R3240_01120 [Gammaproteobacteria bacterium]|nr:hypothetical protein [Gammaproteobacteria bacterium]